MDKLQFYRDHVLESEFLNLKRLVVHVEFLGYVRILFVCRE